MIRHNNLSVNKHLKRTRNIVFNFLFSIVLISFVSCKTNETLQVSAPVEKVKIKSISTPKLLRIMEEKRIDFTTLESKKVNVKFKTTKNSQSLRASFRLHKDSLLLLSAYKTTIPVGKMALTTDSVDLVYYIDKKHFYGSLEEMSKKYQMDLNFQLVQAFFSGDIVSYRQDPKKKDFRNFHVTIENGEYVLSSISKRKFNKVVKDDTKMQRFFNKYNEEKSLFQKIYINPYNFLTSHIEIQDLKEDSVFSLYFTEYTDIEGQLLPSNIVIISEKSGVEQTKIEIKMNRISIDSYPKFNFSVPSKYESKPIK